jgi:microcystin-dependent protein
MTDFAGSVAPTGWLLCDGTIYNVVDYPRLFAVIINAYGGDGVTTFAVPDLRARVTAGVGTSVGDQGFTLSIYLGEPVGDSWVDLSVANLPAASITTSPAGNHNHPGSVTDIQGDHNHTGTTDPNGYHTHGLPPQINFHNGGQDVAGGFDSGINSTVTTNTDGLHTHSFTTSTNGAHQHNLAVSQAPDHVHTFALGSGQPVRVMPPMFGTTKIICCGPPSMQSLAHVVPDGMAGLMASPLRGLN